MTKCSKCTPVPVCDFCKYYDFNGENMVYTDNGRCNKHNERKDPEEGCNDFHCNLADRPEYSV